MKRYPIFIFLIFFLAACERGLFETPPPVTPTHIATATTTEIETPETLAYRNPALPVEERVEDLLARMTLAEKIGQMTLVEKDSIEPEAVGDYFIGALLSGGGGSPAINTPEEWLKMVTAFQQAALSTRLGIPMLYGIDAVHGHNNVKGATIFPHNIGLGATRNPGLVEQIGRATAEEMIATGIYWDYAPVVAVPQDIRWGRTYEGYSENTEVVVMLSQAFIRGLQGDDLSVPTAVLATPKHFIADGGTTWGTSRTEDYQIDQGDTQVDEVTLRAIHLPPYIQAIEDGAMSIMISYSSWDGTKMHAQPYLIMDVLKGELDFRGFVVSDWGGIDQVNGNYAEAVTTAVNAGIDMNMVPYEYERFIEVLQTAVEQGDVPMARIDEAVRRILRVKFELGLFERPFPDDTLSQVGSAAHRELARETVRQSLVLLKNESQVLPLSKTTPLIFVGGVAADDIGLQSGGWTISWQGQGGNITDGSTILQGIEAAVSPETAVEYDRFGRFDGVVDEAGNPLMAEIGIAVVGERPYAEGKGDDTTLTLSEADLTMLARLRERSQKLVVILLSGRPLMITDYLEEWDVLIAAWLPGSEGQGVADMLFGDYPFVGKLPYTWPRFVEQLPFDFAHLSDLAGCDTPLFPFGYGLTVEDVLSVTTVCE